MIIKEFTNSDSLCDENKNGFIAKSHFAFKQNGLKLLPLF